MGTRDILDQGTLQARTASTVGGQYCLDLVRTEATSFCRRTEPAPRLHRSQLCYRRRNSSAVAIQLFGYVQPVDSKPPRGHHFDPHSHPTTASSKSGQRHCTRGRTWDTALDLGLDLPTPHSRGIFTMSTTITGHKQGYARREEGGGRH